MKNIILDASTGSRLMIEVDLSQDFGESKSGKTVIIATTEGNAKIETPTGEVFFVGLNVYKYPPRS